MSISLYLCVSVSSTYTNSWNKGHIQLRQSHMISMVSAYTIQQDKARTVFFPWQQTTRLFYNIYLSRICTMVVCCPFDSMISYSHRRWTQIYYCTVTFTFCKLHSIDNTTVVYIIFPFFYPHTALVSRFTLIQYQNNLIKHNMKWNKQNKFFEWNILTIPTKINISNNPGYPEREEHKKHGKYRSSWLK